MIDKICWCKREEGREREREGGREGRKEREGEGGREGERERERVGGGRQRERHTERQRQTENNAICALSLCSAQVLKNSSYIG